MTTFIQIRILHTPPNTGWRGLVFCLLVALAACKTVSSTYDPDTFQRTAALKERTLRLMDKATEGYAKHATEAKAVLDEATALYARQKTRKQNEASVQQWKLLLEDNAVPGTEAILPGFFKEWQAATDKPLSAFYIGEKKKKVAAAFDEILKLEGAKPKS